MEIGAGAGALTHPLAARARRVVAVELDAALAHALCKDFAGSPNVEVEQADILTFAFPREAHRVLGNIPYARTAEIVRRVTSESSVLDAHLVAQREAAERFAGAPSANESLVSLRLKPWWHVEIVRHLRRTDFHPPPRVESAVLWMARRTPPLVAYVERHDYERFLGLTFGRAPTMRAAMAACFTPEQTRRLASDLRLDLSALPSATRFDQWLGLYRFWRLANRGAVSRPRRRRAGAWR